MFNYLCLSQTPFTHTIPHGFFLRDVDVKNWDHPLKAVVFLKRRLSGLARKSISLD
jgi:hypothetical protein